VGYSGILPAVTRSSGTATKHYTHQLDIVLQKSYASYANEKFYTVLTAAISYLRRQQKVISDMRTKSPKISDTRWESMFGCSSWFKLHHVRVKDHFDQKVPNCSPSSKWWVMITIIESFSSRCTTTFKSVQGHKVTVAMQRNYLVRLQSDLMHQTAGLGPLSDEESASLDPSLWIVSK
jgi:hypothetical protein